MKKLTHILSVENHGLGMIELRIGFDSVRFELIHLKEGDPPEKVAGALRRLAARIEAGAAIQARGMPPEVAT